MSTSQMASWQGGLTVLLRLQWSAALRQRGMFPQVVMSRRTRQRLNSSACLQEPATRWVHPDGWQGRQERAGPCGDSHHCVLGWCVRGGWAEEAADGARHQAGEPVQAHLLHDPQPAARGGPQGTCRHNIRSHDNRPQSKRGLPAVLGGCVWCSHISLTGSPWLDNIPVLQAIHLNVLMKFGG